MMMRETRDETIRRRFWAKVNKGPDCWIWRAGRTGPFGQMRDENQRRVVAHRLAYRMEIGDIPAGMCVVRTCKNPLCVRPAHLRLASERDATLDGAVRASREYRARIAALIGVAPRSRPRILPRRGPLGKRTYLHRAGFSDEDILRTYAGSQGLRDAAITLASRSGVTISWSALAGLVRQIAAERVGGAG